MLSTPLYFQFYNAEHKRALIFFKFDGDMLHVKVDFILLCNVSKKISLMIYVLKILS